MIQLRFALIGCALACGLSCSRATLSVNSTAAAADPAGVLAAGFGYVERNELDSLSALLTDDFLFVSDGARLGSDAFVRMIQSLGITNPHIVLSNIQTRVVGSAAYLVYDRTETFAIGGRIITAPETGSVVLVRTGGRWRIAQWAATSPPARR
jgi:hypothetical protein